MRESLTNTFDHARFDQIVADVAVSASAVDDGTLGVRDSLAQLGEAGCLALGADGGPFTLADQAYVLRSLAAACFATGFATWAQRMAIGYVSRWGSDGLKRDVLAELVTGKRAGATAMATAFQDRLGVRDVPVTFRHDGDDVVVSGVLPWASNVFADGAVIVLPARSADGTRAIVAIRTDLDGVVADLGTPLVALTATASGSVTLNDVRVPSSWLLTTDFQGFLADIRGAFLLLQTALCLGVTDAALQGADGRFTGFRAVLAGDHEELAARVKVLSGHYQRLLADERLADRRHLELRLAAANLAVAATRHEAAVRGGASFLASSPTARRVREAAFLPVQSPTEAQLRWELAHSK